MSPIAAAAASDTDAIRGTADMSPLSRAQDLTLTSQLAHVTIVIVVTNVIAESSIGMDP